MNDKDKEAFNVWRNSTLTRLDIHDAWQAACEYKNKEIDFFKDRNKTNISRVTCINQVNDGLHILLKEAEAENKKLREALENWIQWENGQITMNGEYTGEDINRLIKQAREALKEIPIE